jgi:hypothetical protein
VNDAQELTRLLTTLQSSIGTFTSAIDGARRHLDNVSSGFDKETKELEEQLKKMGKWNKAEDAERMEEIRQHHSHLQRLKKVEQDSRNQMEAAITRAKAHDDNLKALQAEHLKQTAIQHHKSNAVTAEQREAAKKNAEKIATQMRQALLERGRENKAIGELNARLGEAAEVQGKIVDRMNATKKDLAQFSWKDAGKQVGSKAGQAVWSGITSAFSGLTVGNALKGAYENLTDVMATGGDNVLASLDKQADIIKLGLTPDEYIKMNAASRQTILATGGVSKQMDILSKQSEELKGHFKTIGDATKFTQGQMDLLATSGIKPSVHNAGLLNESFKKMKAYTGMTGDAFLQMQQDLSTDADIADQLRAVNMQEREQILASNAARMAEQVAMGMTTEQAKNVTKSLAKMAGAGPLDRIKSAAKMRALGAAMGVEGGDRAANIRIQGDRANAVDKKFLEEYTTKLSNKMSESKTASLGYEIMADRLQTKLGDENTAASSPFNTRLAEAKEIDLKALAQQVEVNTNLRDLIVKVQQLGAAKANPYIQGAGGVVGGVGSVVGPGIGSTLGSFLGTKMGLGGAAAPTTVPTAGAPSTGGSKVGNFLRGPGGKLLGKAGIAGSVGVAGYEAYDAMSEYDAGNITEAQKNQKYGSAGGGLAGALAGMKLGAMGGGAVGAGFGGVGAIPGAVIGGLGGAALGAWGGSSLGGGLGGMFGSDETKTEKEALEQRKKLAMFNAKVSSKMVAPSESNLGSEIMADKLQTKLVDSPKSTTLVSPLTSADTRAETTSPIGMQLSKMDASNEYLKVLTTLTTKQVELAEKQLAATIVSDKDKGELFKSLASNNKNMISYSTLA